MRAVVFRGAGGNEVVSLEERPDPEPAGHDVLIAVRYAGLNPADIAQREGRYPAPPGSPVDIPGLEVAGTVIAVGSYVTGIAPGRRVFGLVGGGGLADRVLAHERHVVAIPDELDECSAAAATEALITAHDAIVTQAGLRSGEVLLVNGANGGVGTAAVQLGAIAGARVVATVRDATLRERVAQLGCTAVDPADAVEAVRLLGGADVVLELVGAPNVESDLALLAPGGRIAIVGTGGGSDASLHLGRLMAKRARLFGTVLRARSLEEKAAAVQAFSRQVVPHLAAGRIAIPIDSVFPAPEVTAAFDRLASPGKLGKVLIEF